jgi:predicted Zn-dependent protease
MNKVVKLAVALMIAVGAMLILIGVITGQGLQPFSSPQGPKEVNVGKSIEGLPNIETLREPGTEPTLNQEVYHDPLIGYSIRIPPGLTVIGNYPGVFRSPDEEGIVGYADTKGIAITVNKQPNDTKTSIMNWFSQEDRMRYLIREPQQTVIVGRPAVQYEANWDTLGVAIGVLIASGDQIFQIDCFYPQGSTQDKERCQKILPEVLQSLHIEGE